jgi:glycosyltransferase 2 family protein
MGRKLAARAGLLGAAAILAVLVWRLGTGPFLDGVRAVDGPTLATAAGIAVLTAVLSAWRWRIVARGLGVELPFGAAVTACYRSVFLNTVVPGGVVGDVHRGLWHGRDVGDVGRGLRAVAWERTAGQLVQILLTVAVLLALPSPVHLSLPVLGGALAVLVPPVVLLGRVRLRSAPTTYRARIVRAARDDVRGALLAQRAWPGVALASVLIVAGHTATFLLAARTTGAALPLTRMLPLALLVLTAMALPNIAGWGPREGAAAWAFSAAGLGAAQGVTTAVAYGVLVLVAALPGAAVLVLGLLPRRNRPRQLAGLS